jgi:putative DNA methylase
MPNNVTTRKKLIEVALPLDAINFASGREKSIRHGHPSTLHLWWARRPLAAARAVIFAQMVDDPSSHPDIFRTEKAQEKERLRLFKIIEELVQWENTTNEEVLERARAEIWQSWRTACADYVDHPRAKELFDRHKLPPFHDPFAGGGALPLEAQRLGLESYASDLNPVAVLINKAMIEIPPRFADKQPVNPEARSKRDLIAREWRGAKGLAEDVRFYGKWMQNEAEKRIGSLYPKVEVTEQMVTERPDLAPYINRKLTVIAWLWARTVKSPNPAFSDLDVPLATTFMLGTKPGKEAYIKPIIEGRSYRFTVKVGKPANSDAAKIGTKSGSSGSSFLCLLSGTPMPFEYLRAEAKAGRMGSRLMAVVAEGDRGRVYFAPTPEMESVALSAQPKDVPETELPKKALSFRVQEYGMTRWSDLFTQRQLVALTTFSDLVQEAHDRAARDFEAANGDKGDSRAYAQAIAAYLGLAIGRVTDYCSTICTWANNPQMEIVRGTFARQAIPMTWDFAEANPFGPSTGSLEILLGWVCKVIDQLPARGKGTVSQHNATQPFTDTKASVISADPPYYDNIGYADLSDFFYVWLRRALKGIFPEIFATLAVPKAEELVASPFRHQNRKAAEAFFLDGMTKAMHQLAVESQPAFPVTIYYAFKQSEVENDDEIASTGWETFLEALISAGFGISGTWPIRTERKGRSIGIGTNALASSIILVCRPRSLAAVTATRREFIAALRGELPITLAHLQRGNIAPVDLAQAAIGPGMGIYTAFAKVLEADGKVLSVREALTLINQTLDEALAEQEGDFDADTRWAVAWFEQFGFDTGEFGVAETLSKAKNTSVAGMVSAKFLSSKGGKVQLLRPDELLTGWDPENDPRVTAWEVVHQLIRALEAGGETAAAHLVAKLGNRAEAARELAYRLYTICERKKRAPQALSYNALVQSWPEIIRLSQDDATTPVSQVDLFGQER